MLVITEVGAEANTVFRLRFGLISWYGPCVPCDMYRDRLLWLLYRVVVWVLDIGGLLVVTLLCSPSQTLDLMTTTQWAIAASTTSDRSLAGSPGTSTTFRAGS
ncbi:hypothetical protein ONS95_008700 [Cadophora gregata]|uniref:uncharacterized protein n=1 Tax=Cadophora gregata TaxID=51156 RepID=UPI0026DA8B98|nr:uncharacterized protein ONS95_008700 [Cadophora gregata]KAK0123689.1 hypothetical protein ONS95_008700 [Cadophora gregata]KAK0130035.1 hypothetical protein ONS96_000573 [Cadophora gregata f. sp. sojae]